MKKQHCMEWYTKKGNDGFKSLGHDLTKEECKKALMKKLKQKSTISVQITWNYVGEDRPDDFDHDYMFGKKRKFNLLGSDVYVENDYIIEE